MIKGSTAIRTRARTETGEDIGDSSGMSAIISIDRTMRSQTHSQASTSFVSFASFRMISLVTRILTIRKSETSKKLGGSIFVRESLEVLRLIPAAILSRK